MGIDVKEGALEDKLIRAKLSLQFKYPFFGFLLLKAKIRKEENGELQGNPIGVSRNLVIVYSPGELEKYDENTIMSMFLHEIMHITLGHFERMDGRNAKVWNMACDYVVNHNMKKMSHSLWEALEKFYLSNGIDFFGKMESFIGVPDDSMIFAEKIYEMLMGGSDFDSVSFDTHAQFENYMSEFEVSQAIFDAYVYNETLKGYLPDFINDIINAMRKPKVDWRRFLNGVFTGMDSSDFTYSRHSKKTHIVESQGLKLPSVEKSDYPRFLVCIDVSGSVPKADIEKFLSEVRALSKLVMSEGDVLFHNVDIMSKVPLKDLKFPLNVPMGGGTSHEWLKDIDFRKYDKIILFTDGDTDFPDCVKETSKMYWFLTVRDNLKEIKERRLGYAFLYI